VLIPIRGRYRLCAGGYAWSDDQIDAKCNTGTDLSIPDLSIGECGGQVEWRTLEPNEVNIALEIASIVPVQRATVEMFVQRWGLPIIPAAKVGDEPAWLSIRTLAQLVRRFRAAIALASSGDLVSLASHFTKHAHVETVISYRHVDRRGPPEMFLECVNLASLAWCQVAQQATTNEEFRRCGWCGTHFVVAGKEGHRRSRRFCSDRCRVAANRAKKRGSSRAY
jgi:hypothetical protein